MNGARVLFFLAAGWLLPPVACGMQEDELPGLVLQSKAIVLAERDESQKPVFKVKKVYLGPVLAGDEFSFYLDVDGLKGHLKTLDADNFLFLTEARDTGSREPETPANLRLLPREIKVLSRGRVYSFHEIYGPGPPGLVLVGENMTLAEYDLKLRQAIVRVESYRAAVRLEDGSRRREALFRLLGPPRPPPIFFEDYLRFFPDGLEAEIIRQINQVAGTHGALKAVARIQVTRLDSASPEVFDLADIPGLLSAAKQPDLDVALRVAALQALDLGPDDRSWFDLPPLLKDPAPEVRRAAAVTLTKRVRSLNLRRRRQIVKSLTEAIGSENDPFTRLVLLGTARILDPDPVDSKMFPDENTTVVLEAAFRDGTVYFVWASPRSHEARFTAVAIPAGGGKAIRSAPYCLDTRFWDARKGIFDFRPALPPGAYRFHLEGLFIWRDTTPDLVVKSRASEITVPASKAR